jgi:hypothetical protein
MLKSELRTLAGQELFRAAAQQILVPAFFVADGPSGGSGWFSGIEMIRRLVRRRQGRDQRLRLDQLRWLGWELAGLDQSLSKSPARRLGPIAPAPDGLIRALPLATPFALAVSIATPLAGPVFGARRSGRRQAGQRVGRLGSRSAAAIVATAAALAISASFSPAIALGSFRRVRPGRVAIKVLGLDVRNVQEAVAADREINEGRLDRRLEVDDPALVNIARVALMAGALHIKLLEDAVLDDGDPTFLGLEHIDEHFFLHAVSFQD